MNQENKNQYTAHIMSALGGIQRDGTPYDSKSNIDGLWTRTYEGKPTKMNGCAVGPLGLDTQNDTPLIVTSMFGWTLDKSVDVYMGRFNSVHYININKQGFYPAYETDITPLEDVLWSRNNINNLWDFDVYTAQIDGEPVSYIVGLVAPNRNDISYNGVGALFYAPVDSNEHMVQIIQKGGAELPLEMNGGVLFVSPVMVAYGEGGRIVWCDQATSGEPLPLAAWPVDITSTISGPTGGNYLVIANTKIVQGYRTRGGALFWSLNSLERASYGDVTVTEEGTPRTYATFTSETVQSDISILSANSVIQYDQMFYWLGVDQPYFYNGLVQTMPNAMNNDWFYDYVNEKAANKIWGVVVPRRKELWWFYPRRSVPNPFPDPTATETQECNAVLIFSLQEEKWYDITKPEDFPLDPLSPWLRSSGIKASAGFPLPIYASNSPYIVQTPVGPMETYPLWFHEYGWDIVGTAGEKTPITSYFTTPITDLWSTQGTATNLTQVWRIVPDFKQTGDMNVRINTQMYPNSPVVSSDWQTFSKDPASPNYKEVVDFETQGALVSFTFLSNTVGGTYQGGKNTFLYSVGDTWK